MLESLSNLTLGAILTALVLVACLMTWGVLTVSHRLQVAYIIQLHRSAAPLWRGENGTAIVHSGPVSSKVTLGRTTSVSMDVPSRSQGRSKASGRD